MAKWMPPSAVPVNNSGKKWTPPSAEPLGPIGQTAMENVQPDMGTPRIQAEPLSPEQERESKWQKWVDKYGQADEGNVSGWPAVIGGTAGGVAAAMGASRAVPMLPPALKALSIPIQVGASALGAYMGGRGGQGLEQGYRMATGKPVGTPEQLSAEQHQAGMEQGTADVIGQPIGYGIGKLIAPASALANRIPGVQAMSESLAIAGTQLRQGVRNALNVTPATEKILQRGNQPSANLLARTSGLVVPQVSDAPFLRGIHKYVMSSPIGGGSYRRLIQKAQPAAYQQLREDMADTFWAKAGGQKGPEELADTFKAVVEGQKDTWTSQFASDIIGKGAPMEIAPLAKLASETQIAQRSAERKAGSQMYKDAYNLLPDKDARIVPPEPIYDLATSIVKEAKPGLGLGSAKGVTSIAGTVGKALGPAQASDAMQLAFKALPKVAQEDLVEKGLMDASGEWIPHEKLTVQEADYLRSVLLEEGRKQEVELGSKNARLSQAVAKLERTTQAEIYRAMSGENPKAAIALMDARKNWAGLEKKYSSDPAIKIADLAKNDPTKLMGYIFAPGATDRVLAAQTTLPTATWTALVDTWKQELIEDAMKHPKSIGGALETRLNKQTPGTLRAILGSDTAVDDFRSLAKLYKNQGSDFLESTFLRRAMTSAGEGGNPATLSNAIFSKGDVRVINKYRARLPKDVYEPLLAQHMETLFKASNLDKSIGDINEETLLAMLGGDKDWAESIRKIGRLDTLFKQVTGEGVGVMASMVQAGSLLNAVRNPNEQNIGLATGAITLPYVIGLTLSNKRAAKYLAQGLKDPAKVNLYARRAMTEVIRYGRQLLVKKDTEERNKSVDYSQWRGGPRGL